MSPRERVLAALSKSETVPPPRFYRDTPSVEERLCEDLGLVNREALLRYLQIDFRWVAPEYIGPSRVNEETGRRRSIWGVEYEFIHFNTDGCDTGGYWQAAEFPFFNTTDPAALDDYPWPTPKLFDFSSLPDQIESHHDYAIMTAAGDASTGVLSVIQDLLGMERALTDPLLNPEFFEKLIAKILDFKLPFVEQMVVATNGGLDFFRIGDDFGTQRGLLMSNAQWQAALRPALKAIVDTAKQCGARYYYHHSCGAVRELIPELIEIGADVLDPLQTRAKGMDPRILKSDFGAKICFSGGIDQQEILRCGTPDEVRKAVHEICDIMAPGGGYFVGPTHNFQADIPTENIVAMYEAAQQWRPK